MFFPVLLLGFVTVVSSVVANPVVIDRSPILSIPLTKIHNITSGHNLVASGLARAQNFKGRAKAHDLAAVKKRQAEPVINEVVSYSASVGVGASDTQYQLIVDTGSSNTWVGAGTKYVASSTSIDTGHLVSVSYGSGEFFGTEYIDKVTLSPSLVITSQSIGVASLSEGFGGTDGIIGIGPDTLTKDTVSGVSTVPTVTDNLFTQSTIAERVVAISFEPTTTDKVTNGELFFGGTDSSKFTGAITYTTKTGDYWGITQTVTYGSTTIQSSLSGIVDTGTTLLYLEETGFNKYIKATGATLDPVTGLYKITTAQYNALENLVFTIGGTEFSLTPNAQIWPRSLNTDIGGRASSIYLVVADLGADEAGFDFIDGYVFLERFYSVFDTTNSRVGFATTSFTTATTN
ncbi:family A1 protease [Lentinula aff. lateritia]|uniref:Family A1 protease n=1 Tax=Lentinula aff. lateritia TaxID=2804960 RepID=A0ACC1U1Q9_9AGAR|nr:family A1 protease [Lentinula aff. lateritia]